MKKILLAVCYPFWFFLSKTWLGNMMMIPIVVGIPMLPFYSLLNQSGEGAQGVGILLAILDVGLFAPIVTGLLMVLSGSMEEYYQERNWKTQLN